MRLRWTKKAQKDLKEIGRYIATDNPQAARQWIAHIKERAKKLIETPRAGRVVPEIEREDIREVIERNYRIVYKVGEKTVDILAVFEAHRLFPKKELLPDLLD